MSKKYLFLIFLICWTLLTTASIFGVWADSASNGKSEPVADASSDVAPLEAALETENFRLSSGWKLQDASLVKEGGAAVSTVGFKDEGWLPATVPGTVLLTYLNQGQIPDPYFGVQAKDIPTSFDTHAYWYRNQFVLPESYDPITDKIWLHFDGINYRAEVFLNGQAVSAGEMNGAFRRFRFDIGALLKAGETNVLAVKVYPPDHPGNPHHDKGYFTMEGNGGPLTQDGPTFIASAGWDWVLSVPGRETGIWNDVYLSRTGQVIIDEPRIITDLPLPKTQTAELTISAVVKNTTAVPQKGILRGRIENPPGIDISFDQAVELAPGASKTVQFDPQSDPQLTIQNPRLWWPNGYGNPELYQLELSFIKESDAIKEGAAFKESADAISDGADGIFDAEISDKKSIRFGIREVTYDTPKETNSELVISINGRRIFCVGGNWGMDEALKRHDRKRLESQIRFHKDAHFNMIRNWIGMTDDEDFYDLCDENGIMVWDDFWLANTVDGPEPVDPGLFLQNAREKIKRYRNHPCVVLWCGRNESTPPETINQDLETAIKELDGTRRYQPRSDASGVHGHGPYTYQPPNNYFTQAQGFSTEIGLPALPTLESIKAMLAGEDLWPINDAWGFHDYTNGNIMASTYTDAVKLRYGGAKTLEDFSRKAQMVNMETYKALFEAWESKRWNPASGILLWVSNPAWPSLGWQLYDYYLEPTAAYFAAKQSCEPVHIMWDQTKDTVLVVNDRSEAYKNLTATARIINQDGKLMVKKEVKINAAPDTVTQCLALKYPDTLSDVYFIKLELREVSGRLISENFYWNGFVRGRLEALNDMKPAPLGAKAKQSQTGDRYVITATVQNTAKTPAVAIRLKILKGSSGQRVLPVFYDDNYFSLLSGETKTVTMDFAALDLNGEEPRLMVEGWNIKPGEIKIE